MRTKEHKQLLAKRDNKMITLEELKRLSVIQKEEMESIGLHIVTLQK